ncbi:MAG: VCBS repeat-containing protein [Acidobacteria bacterium]|nr:VCBS repeat-containing protein [Acidobacteriota bacterium]
MTHLLVVLLAGLGQTIQEGRTISNLLAADLNGDGLADLTIQTADGYGVHLNRGRFRFEALNKIRGIGVGEPGGMALADVNGDGRLDLITGSHDSYRIAILLGDGKGAFQAAPGSPLVPRKGGKPHNHSLAVADLNGDRIPDIASANIGDGDLTLMLGDGKGGFREAANSPLKMGAGAYQVKIADINQDGLPDLLVASTDDRGPDLLVALGKGKGNFELVHGPEEQNHKFRSSQLEITDWDGDGKLDALVGPDNDGRPHVLPGDGKGGFRRLQKALPGQGRTWQFQVLNSVIVAAAGDHIDVIHGETVKRIEAGGSTWNLIVADFDGNGKPDVAAVSGVEVRIHSLDGFIDLGGRFEADRNSVHLAKLHHKLD